MSITDPLFDLTGRVAVVTGGLGRLGTQFGRVLMERGARVAVLDSGELLNAAPTSTDTCVVIAADVTDRASLEAALALIKRRWDTPHVLVNAAAIDSPPDAPAAENGPFENYPEASWDRVIDVNLKGVFLCCQVFGGAMATLGRGSVVNIGSIYGMVSPDQRIYQYRAPFFKPVAYSASKSALLNLTRYLATYWGPRAVRVNSLTLGGVYANQDETFLAGYTARVPLGRMADTKDYDGAVVFLASDASRYMTGSNMVVDGGWTAW